jgi:vacuolar-type H+-ATPase subunit E/Vma4
MRIEIEEVIQADNVAASVVDKAKADAERIEEKALTRAKELIAGKERELASSLDAEHHRVFSEAEAKARGILVDADMYIDRIQEKKEAALDGLLDQLLKKVMCV